MKVSKSKLFLYRIKTRVYAGRKFTYNVKPPIVTGTITGSAIFAFEIGTITGNGILDATT